jgi:hypothetical protein
MTPRARLYWITLQCAAIAAGIYGAVQIFEAITS